MPEVKGRIGSLADRPNRGDFLGARYTAVDAGLDYEWNGAAWLTLVGVGLGALESIGAGLDQALARTERDRWLALIRNGGSATPPGPSAPSIHYIGGDISDGQKLADGSVLWVGPDSLQNPGVDDVVDADDRYTINILTGLVRNAGILEANPGGTFTQQFHQTGDIGIWLNAVAQGGFPADRLWWPMTFAQDPAVNGGNVVVGALLVDGDAPTSSGFQLVDNHLISLTPFLSYASQVSLGFSTRDFQIQAIRKVSPFFYILGQQNVPASDEVGEPSYGTGSLVEIRDHRSYTKIARVTLAQLLQPATWQWWDGSEWVSGIANSTPMADVGGNSINGPSCVHLTPDGHWIFAAMALGDTHLSVYTSENPQGPWQIIARVPVPTAGKPAEGGIEVAWHTKIVGHLAAPPEHSIAMLTMAVLSLAGTGQGINIRRTCPQFVVIPWY